MRLFFNLQNGFVTLGINERNPLASILNVKALQFLPLEVQFHRDGTPERLATTTALQLSVKTDGQFADGANLASTVDWTRPATDAGYYTAILSLNTTPIRTALGIDGNASNDIAKLDSTNVEIQYQDVAATLPTKSQTFNWKIENAVIGGNESTPTSATPPYPAANLLALKTETDLRLLKTANLSDLANAATARTNLTLGNVDNTSDANKPVSTAAQTVLDAKASAVVGKTLYVDSVYGNDATGARATTKPFLTLTAAKTAAVSGDTIVVRPGAYTDTNLLKNNVNWKFEIGSFVTNSSATIRIFDDYTSGANGVVTCQILGAGNFDGGTRGVLYLRDVEGDGLGSSVVIEADTMTSSGTTVDVRLSTLFLRCRLIISTGTTSTSAIWWRSGATWIEADGIYGSGPATVYSTAGVSEAVLGTFLWIKAKEIKNTSTTISSVYKAIWFQDGDTTVRQWIDALQIVGPIAVNTTSSGSRGYIKAEKIFGQINHTAGTLYVDAQKISDFGLNDSLLQLVGGKSWINIGQFDDAAITSSEPTVLVSGGTGVHYLNSRSLTRVNSGDGISISGGTLDLVNASVSTEISATSNPINKTGGTLILRAGISLIAQSTRDSITASTAQDVKVYGTAVANKAKNANVTIQVGTLTVDTNVS